MLEGLGCEVAIVGNGKAAVDAVRESSFDIVLMDCHMPVMDGFEATRAIRELPSGQRVPIVAMTASALEGDRERCLAAGMDDYVAKPVSKEILADAITRHALRAEEPELVLA